MHFTPQLPCTQVMNWVAVGAFPGSGAGCISSCLACSLLWLVFPLCVVVLWLCNPAKATCWPPTPWLKQQQAQGDKHVLVCSREEQWRVAVNTSLNRSGWIGIACAEEVLSRIDQLKTIARGGTRCTSAAAASLPSAPHAEMRAQGGGHCTHIYPEWAGCRECVVVG